VAEELEDPIDRRTGVVADGQFRVAEGDAVGGKNPLAEGSLRRRHIHDVGEPDGALGGGHGDPIILRSRHDVRRLTRWLDGGAVGAGDRHGEPRNVGERHDHRASLDEGSRELARVRRRAVREERALPVAVDASDLIAVGQHRREGVRAGDPVGRQAEVALGGFDSASRPGTERSVDGHIAAEAVEEELECFDEVAAVAFLDTRQIRREARFCLGGRRGLGDRRGRARRRGGCRGRSGRRCGGCRRGSDGRRRGRGLGGVVSVACRRQQGEGDDHDRRAAKDSSHAAPAFDRLSPGSSVAT
jgi:hypothetical protein